MEIWPNFFIIGAQKAATTSLYEYLRQIPGVYMSAEKEPYYFISHIEPDSIYKGRVIRDKSEYLRLFKGVKNETAIGEASPLYLWDPGSAEKIYKHVPNARIIAILRDPIQRAFSHYMYMVRFGTEKLPFYEAIIRDHTLKRKGWGISNLYVELGLYAEQISRYFTTFGKSNVKVLIFEEFIKNPISAVDNIIKFLGIEIHSHSSFISGEAYNSHPPSRPTSLFSMLVKFTNKNRTAYKMSQLVPANLRNALIENVLVKKQPKPTLSAEARDYLRRVYVENAGELSSILGRELPWNL